MKRVRNAFLLVGLLISGALSGPAIANRGAQVFLMANVERFGGVLLQGTSRFLNDEGQIIPIENLELKLTTQSGDSQQVCIMFEETCYEMEILPEVALSIAEWVLTEQTGAYSAWHPHGDGMELAGEELAEFVPVVGGYAPIELAQFSIPETLAFLDFDLLINASEDDSIRAKYNSNLGADFDPRYHSPIGGSYINTDTDANFETRLVDNQALTSGLVSRYHWTGYEGIDYAYIDKVEQACSPKSVKAFDVDECSALVEWTDFLVVDEYGYYSVDDYGYYGEEPVSLDSADLQTGDYVAFYLVVNTTADSILDSQTGLQESDSEYILLSLPSANADQLNHMSLSIGEEGTQLLMWEDQMGEGDRDFNDLKIGVKNINRQDSLSPQKAANSSDLTILKNPKGEAIGVFQLTGQTDEYRSLQFEVLGKDAHYASEFGFFKVDDNQGSVDGLMPDHPEYILHALDRSRAHTAVSHLGLELYQPQKEAILFAQAVAILRRFADDNPQKLEDFIQEAKLHSEQAL